jgi:hypothetical protein
MNRKRYTAARRSLRRIAAASALGAAALAIASAASTLARWSAENRDASIAEVSHWLRTGKGPLTVAALHGSPDDLEARAWDEWSARLAASARR